MPVSQVYGDGTPRQGHPMDAPDLPPHAVDEALYHLRRIATATVTLAVLAVGATFLGVLIFVGVLAG